MKKSLLIAAALVSATAGFAQAPITSAKVKAPRLPLLKTRMTAERLDQKVAAPAVRHSLTTNNYFSHPEGTFYIGYGLDGRGSLLTSLEAPFTKGVDFVEAGSITPTWKQGGRAITDASGKTYHLDFDYPGSYYAPYVVNRTDSFCVGTNNIYTMGINRNDSRFADYKQVSNYLNWGTVGSDTISVLLPADDHSGYIHNGKLYSNGAYWGALTTDYMYGTGQVDYGDGTFGDVYSVEQILGTTTAPLYVERVVASGLTHTTPIKNNGQLVALITGVKTVTYSKGTTAQVADLDNVLDTLYATSTDTLDFKTSSEMNGKTIYEGKVLFSKKKVDEFGTEVEEPFIIPENTKFAVYITGFQDTTNVDFGLAGLQIPDEDQAGTEFGHFNTTINGESGYTHTYDGTALNVGLVGMYDGVTAPEANGIFDQDAGTKANVVRISNDGNSCQTDGATQQGFLGAVVYTTLPWYDSEGNENYRIDDLPDWVTSVEPTDLSFEPGTSGLTGSANADFHLYVLNFKATALPSGTTKRAATVHVVSDKGAVSDGIILLQGNATVADGINAVSAENAKVSKDNRIFNLAGQQVDKSYKGIVIKNGQKTIQ